MNPELENKAVTDHAQHKPRVSIGMPVYNGAKYIREALDSLLAQTFTDFELIISDNASTDETEVICREYAAKDKRIRYIRQPENRGAIANFQFVLDEAVGEYFMWAAADDLNAINFIELLVSALDENPSFACVMTDVLNIVEFDNNNSFISILDDIRLSDAKKNWHKMIKRFFRNPTSNIFFCIYGLYRKEILKLVDLNYQNLHKYAFSSEIALLAQVATRGKIGSIPYPLKIYRRHHLSIYHKEQKLLRTKDRLLGFLSVSVCLILIAKRSDFSIYRRVNLMLTTLATSLSFLCYRQLRTLSVAIRNTLHSKFIP